MTTVHQNSQHPNAQQAFAPWSEDQKLHVAVMYSNPLRWATRRQLFNDFRKRTAASPNVVLYVGEVAYGDRPFEVTSAANPLDLQFRSTGELWLKENVLNLVVQRFPANAQYFAYLDGDIVMSRYDWALEAIHLLQHYGAVQLFSQFTDMDAKQRPLGVTNGFTYEYAKTVVPGIYRDRATLTPAERQDLANGALRNATYGALGDEWGTAASSSAAVKEAARAQVWWGATGLGWAYTKAAWKAMGGLLDTCILGSADWHMAYGMAGLSSGTHQDFRGTDAYTHSIQTWQERAAALDANIWYVDNHITHYFHGPKANRFYRDRTQILIDNRFDPYRDLQRDHQGLWQLSPGRPQLRDHIRAYFRARNEDDPNLDASQRLVQA